MSGRSEGNGNVARLGEIANSAPSQGGGFAYDEATMRTLITKWLELAHSYRESMSRGRDEPVVGPGLDLASERQAAAVTRSLREYGTYVGKNYQYCIGQAQLLQNTLNDYLGIERQNVTDLLNAGSSSEL
jgi:hypothetical protein